jgi:hypothetical protein
MSNFKITKLDGRHTGHELFSHYINYKVYVRGGVFTSISNNELNFLKARVWFWEKFGPSSELGKCHWINSINHQTPDWAWQTEHNLLRIYVTEEALAFFTLAQST